MTANTTHAPRAPGPIARNIGAVVAISAFLTFTNPFGATAALPAWGGFLYWVVLVAEGWFGGGLIGAWLNHFFPNLGPTAVRVLATALVAVGVSVTIAGIQWAIGDSIPLAFVPTLYSLVLGISIAIAAIGWLLDRAFGDRVGAVTRPRRRERSRFGSWIGCR